ncbi:MAG TPA: bifunctional phosphoribosylaminoimidazolecarboxamide formyltransferase/IMP cyclohydrolase, partial [Pyrinomonadaceae bacterium]|nr:bifunctional phosphoribosylaminoimidazolecarboxamide formyltransferase/IMP cyclohydrolase [Pyrinomonadaceae bacterium]
MTQDNELGLRKIRRALISVSDKTGIVDFAGELKHFNVEIISTGGTAKVLRDAGIESREVSEITGFPEMMDGRVKTLHPKIHGALLGVRDNPEHQAAMQDHGIEPIDMIVINLYPFEETIARDGVTIDEAVEQIDIGGPAMIRSAAKNFRDVAVIVTPGLYRKVRDELKANEGAISQQMRSRLARLAFLQTAKYDRAITWYLESALATDEERARLQAMQGESAADHFSITQMVKRNQVPESAEGSEAAHVVLPSDVILLGRKQCDLRYGENPHQQAALYTAGETEGIAQAELLGGKEMSYNNYVDADAAWQLVCDFDELACAIIKHTNPAGVGLGTTPTEAYQKALATDPVSAFGGIAAFNRTVDEQAAQAVTEIFTEVIVAPDYRNRALEILRVKKNLRVLRVNRSTAIEGLEYKQISGGMLAQTRDTHKIDRADLKVVTQRPPTEAEIRALLF